jgi:hypothetical protein
MKEPWASFLSNIELAAAWVSHQPIADWRSQAFRSAQLLPQGNYEATFAPQFVRPSVAAAFVDAVIKNRRSLIMRDREVSSSKTQSLDGRLLRHNFGETTYSLDPMQLSDGYFDRYDIPAWDTWIAYVNDLDGRDRPIEYLLSWVPQMLIEQVDRAVKASFEENIMWLDGTNTRLTKSTPKEWPLANK